MQVKILRLNLYSRLLKIQVYYLLKPLYLWLGWTCDGRPIYFITITIEQSFFQYGHLKNLLSIKKIDANENIQYKAYESFHTVTFFMIVCHQWLCSIVPTNMHYM